MYSKKLNMMYTVIFGGLSFGYFDNGTFQTDPEIPFINQVTTIALNRQNKYKQYLMKAQYPTILSTKVNPGNPLLFGAGAKFIPVKGLETYKTRY